MDGGRQIALIERRLQTAANSDGFIPGEAAAAVLLGKPDRERPGLRCEGIGVAKDRLIGSTVRTILFIDEIHRFNRAQQDVLLDDVESGPFADKLPEVKTEHDVRHGGIGARRVGPYVTRPLHGAKNLAFGQCVIIDAHVVHQSIVIPIEMVTDPDRLAAVDVLSFLICFRHQFTVYIQT